MNASKAARKEKRDRDQEGETGIHENLKWYPSSRGREIKEVSPRKRRRNEKARTQYGATQQHNVYEQHIAVLEVASIPFSLHPSTMAPRQ